MKQTKYLVFIMLLMLFCVNKTNAETCFYQTSEVALEYESSTNIFTIRQRNGDKDIVADNEGLINKNKAKYDGQYTGLEISKISTECPNYIVYRRKERLLWWASDGIWGFDKLSDANNFKSVSEATKNMYAWTASQVPITREQFENNITENVKNYKKAGGGIGINPNANFGGTGLEKSDMPMSCGELFDQEIIDLINEILQYPRLIVPGIILVLGTLDLFKAVIAGKEDEMKKAQKTFIKRLIIGVCVFMVPVFINAIMWLANLAWQGLGYTTCSL